MSECIFLKVKTKETNQNKPHINWQIFDIKMLADMEHTYRHQLRAHLRAHRVWKRKLLATRDTAAQFYSGLEGAMLRRTAIDSVRFYWTIRRDFRHAFYQYMHGMKQGMWQKLAA